MTTPHLDDERLSSLLDEEGRDPHLVGCAPCKARLQELTTAREAVAGATVAPLPASVIDGLVAASLRAVATDEPESQSRTISLDPARRRARRGPPPTWLLSAAAAIAVLAGIAGVVRSTSGTGSDEVASTTLDSGDAGGVDGRFEQKSLAAPEAVGDPELVRGDLGDQDDPSQLAVALGGAETRSTGSASGGGAAAAASSPVAGAAESAPRAQTGEAATPAAGGATTAADAAGGADRAQCRAAAERIGAGRLGVLESTSLVRWKGQPAEVLVFTLVEPAEGVSRQALVLRRPGCDLLADPRF